MTPEQQLEIKDEYNAIVAEANSKLRVIEEQIIALLKQIQFDSDKTSTKLEKLTKKLVKIIIAKGLGNLAGDETFENFEEELAVELISNISKITSVFLEAEILIDSLSDCLKNVNEDNLPSLISAYSNFNLGDKEYKVTYKPPSHIVRSLVVNHLIGRYKRSRSEIRTNIPYSSFDMFLKCNIREAGKYTYYIARKNRAGSIKDKYDPVNNPGHRLMLRYDTDNNILANLYFLEVWGMVRDIIVDMEYYTAPSTLEIMQGLVAAMMRADGIEVDPTQLDFTPSLTGLSVSVGKATDIKANKLFDFIKVVKDPDIITLIEDESLIFNWFAYYSSNKDTIYGIDPEVRLYQYRLMSSILQYAHSTGTITLAQAYCEALYNFDNHLEYQIAIRDLCMSKGDNLDTIIAKLERAQRSLLPK